jgi:hypothetical protein
MFLDHTQTHTLGRTALSEWSAQCRGCYLHNTQQTQKMNIHIPQLDSTHGPIPHMVPLVRWLNMCTLDSTATETIMMSHSAVKCRYVEHDYRCHITKGTVSEDGVFSYIWMKLKNIQQCLNAVSWVMWDVITFQLKCEQYWPEIGQEVTYSIISILNASTQVFADFTFRLLNVTCKGKTRKVCIKNKR